MCAYTPWYNETEFLWGPNFLMALSDHLMHHLTSMRQHWAEISEKTLGNIGFVASATPKKWAYTVFLKCFRKDTYYSCNEEDNLSMREMRALLKIISDKLPQKIESNLCLICPFVRAVTFFVETLKQTDFEINSSSHQFQVLLCRIIQVYEQNEIFE